MTLQSDSSFVGLVYRAHDPGRAWDPLSSEGARLHGGRFNKKGTPALYTALTILGAVREAAPFGLPLQPITICSYQVNVRPLFDATDHAKLALNDISDSDLACPEWRSENANGEVSASQRLGDRLVNEGYAGMLVRSFAHGATDSDINLVFWEYGPQLPTRVVLVDDDGRLS